jgi:hypothetical protein
MISIDAGNSQRIVAMGAELNATAAAWSLQ